MSAGSIPSGDQIKDPGYPTASENYLTNSKGALTWLFTLDHKRIGVMYLIGVMTAFFTAGILALLIRLHLLEPDGFIFSGAKANIWYNRVFTLHGAIMVFLFIIPSVPAALGNFLVPVMLGAKDVAFPRLNLSVDSSVSLPCSIVAPTSDCSAPSTYRVNPSVERADVLMVSLM